MTTYTIDNVGTAGHPANAAAVRVVDMVIDFSETTNVANDVFECISIPANTYIITAGVDVLTADSAGNSGTLSLGDGADVDRYITAAAPGSTTMTIRAQAGSSASGASVAHGIFAAADTLDLVVGTGALNGKYRVWALTADFGGMGDAESQVVGFS